MTEEDLQFNEAVAVDLGWIEKRSILHITGIYTCYQNTALVRDKSTEGLRKQFVEIWATFYWGFPDALRLYREPFFIEPYFRRAAEGCRVDIQASAMESHNAIGVRERYHAIEKVLQRDQH